VTAMEHPLTWAAPRPLWRGAVPPARTPTILRFASDEFMDQLLGMLATDPSQLGSHVARYETWRTPEAELATADLVERVPLPAPMKKARLGRFLKQKAVVKPAASGTPTLKLYQPAHQRYYVAAATLACAVPGLPDRAMRGGHEQAGFVLRRLMPPSKLQQDQNKLVEYAFVKSASGNVWQRVADGSAAVLAPAEETLPVFPLSHLDSQQVKRTMWGGLIPVGRREEYLAASVNRTATALMQGQMNVLQPAAAQQPRNSSVARMTEFKMDVAEPWKVMIRAAIKAAADIAADPDDDGGSARRASRARETNRQFQMQSWLILLDWADYLERHLPSVHNAIKANSSAGLSGYKLSLYNWLGEQMSSTRAADLNLGLDATSPAHERSIRAALRKLLSNDNGASSRDKLEKAETLYTGTSSGWPDFHFLLAGVARSGAGAISADGPYAFTALLGSKSSPPLPDYPDADDPSGILNELPEPGFGAATAQLINDIDKVTALVARALDPSTEATARPLPFAQQLAKTMEETASDGGLFCLRFVHVNEDCGPLHPPTLSETSEHFQLASFFDSDAPARPIRISLPTDTSPAGLRKHARGTAFVMSDMLCGQVQRAKGLGFIDLVLQVLPWPLHKEINLGDGGGCKSNSIEIGMICSLSLPIITLCALILLMIIVMLLDFIFRWIPWFILCFPVPGLKGKK
jgi:hypothetical protein